MKRPGQQFLLNQMAKNPKGRAELEERLAAGERQLAEDRRDTAQRHAEFGHVLQQIRTALGKVAL